MLNENPSSQSAGCTGSGRSSRTELAGRVCRLIDPEFLKTRTLQRSLETFKRNGCAEIWLAEQADKIVGFCRIGREENNGELLGEIVALYLLPQFQRQGIGKQLMQAGIDQLRQRGYSIIVLWVLKSNVQARQFYEHCGFTAEPVEKTLDMGTLQIVVRYRLTCES